MIRGKLGEYVSSVIYAVVIFMLLYVFLWPVRIIGISMEPTLVHGDRVFVSRALAFVGAYERGDLVMMRVVNDSIDSGRYIIKRIIASEGDVLLIEDGQVFINGEPLEFEAYIVGGLSLTLEDDMYFLIGDNSIYSVDSRDFGAVHRGNIRGKVLFRFWGGSVRID